MKLSQPIAALLACTLLALAACAPAPPPAKRVIVLAVDGMDPVFLETHFAALPNLARLRDRGGLSRLATTTPPQSPVAWATFATGTDPLRHGVFDFVHRDPATLQPFSSLAATEQPGWQLPLGPYLLPLTRPRVRSLRAGLTFWEILAAHGIPVTLLRMPGNYPPLDHAGLQLSGMGTPDMDGTYGTFTWYTDDPLETPRSLPGGRIVPVTPSANRFVLPIAGPPNTLRRDRRPTTLDLTGDIDPAEPIARVRIAGRQFLLHQGEWSPWIRVRLPLVPGLASVAGMFRLYAGQLHPGLRIYRSPLNLDPSDPALPISSPASFSRDLAARTGPFYTQGIAEDTAALRQGLFTLSEYLRQSRLIAEERARLLRDSLARFRSGLLFFYFSEIDQDSHVLWGAHQPELLATYQSIDRQIGDVMAAAPDATLIVMSDHGFAPFLRAVNLNTWLARAGYLALEPTRHIDWPHTRAYATGLNALYLNLAGRERQGIVHPGPEADTLLATLSRELLELRDPDDGRNVISAVSAATRGAGRLAPDLIVGYAPGYRASWETANGEAPPGSILRPNIDAWIADHCIDPAAVPGVLLGTSRPRLPDPALKDLTVTLLKEFALPQPPTMTGRPLY